MIWMIGKTIMGADGRRTLAIHKAQSEDTNKIYYFMTIVDNKTKQILIQENISKEMMQLFKKAINDSSLEGMII